MPLLSSLRPSLSFALCALMFGQKATLGLGVMLSCDGFESDSDSFNAAVLTAREQS